MEVVINKRKYSLYFRDSDKNKHMRDAVGICDDPKKKTPIILIRTHLKPVKELDTCIHEMLHASGYDFLAEEWVERTATDIARALYKLGWRKESN